MSITITGDGEIRGANNVFQTGDFQPKQRKSTPPGWIVAAGGTFGNVGSGATVASIETLALFVLWWAEYTNAELPILTSAGDVSTRGASALADWAALKRMTMFNVSDRVVRMAGTIQGNGAYLEATRFYYDGINDGTVRVAHAASQPFNADKLLASDPVNIAYAAGTNGGMAANQTTASVRVASIGMLGFYKL